MNKLSIQKQNGAPCLARLKQVIVRSNQLAAAIKLRQKIIQHDYSVIVYARILTRWGSEFCWNRNNIPILISCKL